MPYKFKRDCSVCGKRDLLYSRDHLRQIHQLQPSEKKQWLSVATFSGSKRTLGAIQGNIPHSQELHMGKKRILLHRKKSISI